MCILRPLWAEPARSWPNIGTLFWSNGFKTVSKLKLNVVTLKVDIDGVVNDVVSFKVDVITLNDNVVNVSDVKRNVRGTTWGKIAKDFRSRCHKQISV